MKKYKNNIEKEKLIKYQKEESEENTKENKNKLPDILIELIKCLNKMNEIKIDNKVKDGRINSIINEDLIVDNIKKCIKNNNIKIKIIDVKVRFWCDIIIEDIEDNIKYPINIKISNCKNADNIGNLSILLYSLTNFDMEITNNITYNNNFCVNKLIKEINNKNYNTTNRDYYFIIFNKQTKKFIINSILGLSKISFNNNNLPFQINWGKNTEYIYHTPEEQTNNIINGIKNKKANWSEIFIKFCREFNQ